MVLTSTLNVYEYLQIAVVFDFLGAILLGRVVTSTIASGVADLNSFLGNPEVYAYGMICACTAGSFWLAVASRVGINVSGTHFIGTFRTYAIKIDRMLHDEILTIPTYYLVVHCFLKPHKIEANTSTYLNSQIA